jgi:hypothetical protein
MADGAEDVLAPAISRLPWRCRPLTLPPLDAASFNEDQHCS